MILAVLNKKYLCKLTVLSPAMAWGTQTQKAYGVVVSRRNQVFIVRRDVQVHDGSVVTIYLTNILMSVRITAIPSDHLPLGSVKQASAVRIPHSSHPVWTNGLTLPLPRSFSNTPTHKTFPSTSHHDTWVSLRYCFVISLRRRGHTC